MNISASGAMMVTTVILAVLLPFPLYALETIVVESACRAPGLSKPLRQTIVIVDQAIIESRAAGDIGEANRRWMNKVLTVAGVQDGQTSVISAPRERLTVLLATQDGSDLVRAFTGCVPIYSPTELEVMRKASSGLGGQLDRFLGRDIDHKVDLEKKVFRSKLTGALSELLKIGAARSAMVTSDSFLKAFSVLPSSVDLNDGIPRLILISPMNVAALKGASDVKTARSLGFELASKVNADLQRSEVYITSISPDFGKFGRDFSQTFFLGMKGRVAAANSEASPTVSDAPTQLKVFSGFIDYAGVKVPMQIRLAVDRSGTLVNSWAEVSVRKPIATPLSGKAVCKNDDESSCEIKGDGKEFAQSWSIDGGGEPKFDESLPFSGVRYFEFTTDKNSLRGRIFDPLVVINGKKDLPFELTLTPAIRF